MLGELTLYSDIKSVSFVIDSLIQNTLERKNKWY